MNLLKDNIKMLYVKFLFPSILSALVTMVYSFVDTIAIGQGVGPDGVAVSAIIYPIFGIPTLWEYCSVLAALSILEKLRAKENTKKQMLIIQLHLFW